MASNAFFQSMDKTTLINPLSMFLYQFDQWQQVVWCVERLDTTCCPSVFANFGGVYIYADKNSFRVCYIILLKRTGIQREILVGDIYS